MIKRPCPYVHSDVEGELTDAQKPWVNNILKNEYWVHCPVCEAAGPIMPTAEEAVFAWNHRNEEA